MKNKTFRLATRPSKLAMAQSQIIARLIEKRHADVNVELIQISTHGDKDQITPISGFGGTGAFVKELEEAILCGKADFAVHSLKDVPAKQAEGLVLCAYPLREDARDVFITKGWKHWSELPDNSSIGTSSLCRSTQLKKLRPGFSFREIRGNIDTRIRKCISGEYDAIILAAAGLKRLGIQFPQKVLFTINDMTPSPGQGALVLQADKNNIEILKLLEPLNNLDIEFAVNNERLFMTELNSGCREPLGAHVKLNKTFARATIMLGDSESLTFNKRSLYCKRTELTATILKQINTYFKHEKY